MLAMVRNGGGTPGRPGRAEWGSGGEAAELEDGRRAPGLREATMVGGLHEPLKEGRKRGGAAGAPMLKAYEHRLAGLYGRGAGRPPAGDLMSDAGLEASQGAGAEEGGGPLGRGPSRTRC